jgi:4-hydroxy-4-methyl-2-oxoglutarate aldolase
MNTPDILRDFDRVSADVVRQAAGFQAAILADVAGRRGALHGRIRRCARACRWPARR